MSIKLSIQILLACILLVYIKPVFMFIVAILPVIIIFLAISLGSFYLVGLFINFIESL